MSDTTDFKRAINLTNHVENGVQATGPDWHPDGNRIAYTYSTGAESIIMVMNRDGIGQKRLEPFADRREAYDSEHHGMDHEGSPVWSPDGSKIAFVSSRPYLLPVNYEIYVANSDGSDLIQLTKNGTANIAAPQWSPDGKKIVCQSVDDGSGRRGESNIWIVNSDGSAPPIRITYLEGGKFMPVWSPDGNTIAFLSSRGGRTEIWAMDADETNVRQVTATQEPFGFYEYPQWVR